METHRAVPNVLHAKPARPGAVPAVKRGPGGAAGGGQRSQGVLGAEVAGALQVRRRHLVIKRTTHTRQKVEQARRGVNLRGGGLKRAFKNKRGKKNRASRLESFVALNVLVGNLWGKACLVHTAPSPSLSPLFPWRPLCTNSPCPGWPRRTGGIRTRATRRGAGPAVGRASLPTPASRPTPERRFDPRAHARACGEHWALEHFLFFFIKGGV